jgi:hypothetical protein
MSLEGKFTTNHLDRNDKLPNITVIYYCRWYVWWKTQARIKYSRADSISYTKCIDI